MVTLDRLIEALERYRRLSPIGGQTCVYVSLTGSERDALPVETVALEHTKEPPTGVVFLTATLPENQK